MKNKDANILALNFELVLFFLKKEKFYEKDDQELNTLLSCFLFETIYINDI